MITNFWKISTLVLTILLTLSLATNVIFTSKIFNNFLSPSNKNLTGQASFSSIKTVSAKEIYSMFVCGCCGKPLDQCTCGMAKESIDYIDSLVKTKTSEDEIVMTYVKKYGLNSFVDKNKQEEFREKLIAVAPADRPQIVITPETYDFGDVSQKEGKVYTYFELKNEGKSDLVIDRLETSCGCTFAAVIFQDKESPYFTMPGHGYENPEWDGVTIPAGQIAQLKVMYDPDVHPDFRGAATREIHVFSNDPIDFEKKIQVELNQVD